MKAEIIAVGTELLLGQIVNTNAQAISQKLAEIGIDVYFQTVVGDNANRLRQAIEIGRGRADLLVFTGGLGPTQDDLTKDVLADYLGRELGIHEPSMEAIKELFSSRGAHMVESNRRQAHLILGDGSEPLHNATGLAVGNGVEADGTLYMLLPGPPKEMLPMLDGPGVDWLRLKFIDEKPLYSRILKFAGIGESNLEAALIDMIDAQTDLTIAPYAKEGEVALRLSTKSASQSEADAIIDAAVAEIMLRVGDHLYAQEDVPLEAVIIQQLRTAKKRVASAESCSGGLFAELVTSIPGSSGEFLGGVVTYTNLMKHKLLGIPMSQLEGDGAPGAISESTAKLMAEQIMNMTGADYGVSLTGVAGPAESEGKPVGLVYFAVAERGKETIVYTSNFRGGREMIRIRAVKSAMHRLWQTINA
ncbi:competence/damage-inducible protein A [Paenibacillus sp. strain BS8-2]